MTKRKKLAKKALKTPEKFSLGELAFFQKWLEEHKRKKAELKRQECTKESKQIDEVS